MAVLDPNFKRLFLQGVIDEVLVSDNRFYVGIGLDSTEDATELSLIPKITQQRNIQRNLLEVMKLSRTPFENLSSEDQNNYPANFKWVIPRKINTVPVDWVSGSTDFVSYHDLELSKHYTICKYPDVPEESLRHVFVCVQIGRDPLTGEIRPSTVNPYEGCLLYTSPSPRDRQKSRMPSSA